MSDPKPCYDSGTCCNEELIDELRETIAGLEAERDAAYLWSAAWKAAAKRWRRTATAWGRYYSSAVDREIVERSKRMRSVRQNTDLQQEVERLRGALEDVIESWSVHNAAVVAARALGRDNVLELAEGKARSADEIVAQRAEIERLRTALQFYAVHYNGNPEYDDATATICNDHGETARKALGQ